MSIYEIPGIVKYAFPLAATPTNICNAFKKAGIWPYDSTVFTDEDFAPSFVTDRPMPDNLLFQEMILPDPSSVPDRTSDYHRASKYTDSSVDSSPSIIQSGPLQCHCSVDGINEPGRSGIEQSINVDCGNEPGPSGRQQPESQHSSELIPRYHAQAGDHITFQTESNDAPFSPELIRSLPKAPPRLLGHNKQRKRKSAVLTDTPEKNALAEEQAKKKKESKTKVNGKGKARKENKKKTKQKRKNAARRKVLQEDDESTDEEKTN